ncbi:unnamed protein product [Pieris brassicae]|uniref:Uncharacterized protein n=1 Tax=Pieris brassicae TaxID=7116 RepID=A0A9P0SM04_PIEBR|nr:unnamed protein product [Pieris brassicae]
MSVLTYQEFTRRIEELTRCIFELDPFYVVEDDPAATLAMLVSTADRARANRRPRSPERREARSPSTPAWLLPGTTYAEIVKGQNSRSSSIDSRQHSAQRLTHRMHTPEATEVEVKEPVIREMTIGSASPEIQQSDSVVSKSSPNMSETWDYSEIPQCRNSESEIFSENVSYDSVSKTQNYTYGRNDEVDAGSAIHQNPITSVESHSSQILTLPQLEPPDNRARSMSPANRYRSQDLSYAEILALGLKRQPKTQVIMSLPKPQVAQVEIVKEIIVEVEKVPQQHVIDKKIASKGTTKYRSERPDRPERPSQRSRSRDMPRQRRGPEKRPTKNHDTQILKKKKITKKVIEVEEFEETPEVVSSEPTKPVINTPLPEAREDDLILKSPLTVTVETKNDNDIDESKSESIEPSHKKLKKKQKSKRTKDSDDEIEKALKEIERNSSKQRKKKQKSINEKPKKESDTAITCNTESLDLSEELVKREPTSQVISIDFITDPQEIKPQAVEDVSIHVSIDSACKETDDSLIKGKITNTDEKCKKRKKSKKNKASSELNTKQLDDNEQSIESNVESKSQIIDFKENVQVLQENTIYTLKENSSLKENLVTLDWNVLMEEEENVTESSIPLEGESYQMKDISAQVATEVNIIPESNEIYDSESILQTDLFIEPLSQNIVEQYEDVLDTNRVQEAQFSEPSTSTLLSINNEACTIDFNVGTEIIHPPHMIYQLDEKESQPSLQSKEELERYSSSDIKYIKTIVDECTSENIKPSLIIPSKSEKNNNYKFIATDPLKEINDVLETDTCKPHDVDTHTIYLITHEEKKLPPIRTVKVFTSKDVPTDDVNENPNNEPLTSNVTDECVESVTRNEEIQYEQTTSETKSFNIVNYTETVNENAATTINNVAIEIPRQLETEIDKTEMYPLEEVIFGSVQDRNKSKENTEIPYKELIDEVKTYSINLDYEQLDYNFYELIKGEKENELSSTTKLLPVLDLTLTESNSQGSNEISAIYEKPIDNYYEITDSEKLLGCIKSIDEMESVKVVSHLANLSKRDDIEERETLPECKTMIKSSNSEDENLTNNLENTILLNKLIINMKSELPRQHYYELRDAEKMLGVINYNKILYIDLNKDDKNEVIIQDTDIKNKTIQHNISVVEDSADDVCKQLKCEYEQVANSDQEIKKAEEVLAISNSRAASEEPANIIDNSQGINMVLQKDNISIDPNKEKHKHYSSHLLEVPYYSYTDIRDAEILLASITTIVPREPLKEALKNESDLDITYIKTEESSINDLDVQIALEATFVNNSLIMEKPRFNYQEIQSAEMKYANICVQNAKLCQNSELTLPVFESSSINVNDLKGEVYLEVSKGDDLEESNDNYVINVNSTLTKEPLNSETKNSVDEIITHEFDLNSTLNKKEVKENSADLATCIIDNISPEDEIPILNIVCEKIGNIEQTSVIELNDEVNVVNDEDDFVIVDMTNDIYENIDQVEKKASAEVDRQDSQALHLIDYSVPPIRDTNKNAKQIPTNICYTTDKEKPEKIGEICNIDVSNKSVCTENKASSDTEPEFEIITTPISDIQDLEIIEPISISADDHLIIHTIQSTDSHQPDFNDTPGHFDTEKESTDLDIINIDKNNYEIVTKDIKVDNRVEKSPIHSLHELLPEIDSIPEFKPTYPNTFFSNLSADAPEFTPSYMIQSLPTDTVLNALENPDSDTELKRKNLDSKSYSAAAAFITLESKNLEDTVLQQKLEYIERVSPAINAEKNPDSDQFKNREIKNTSISPQANTDTENVWVKMLDDSKSYAEIVAEGLTINEQKAECQEPKIFEESASTSFVREKTLQDLTTENTKAEVGSSWAKIAATKSPLNFNKNTFEQTMPVPAAIHNKTPVILVDESDVDHHKIPKEIDSEGFITVERSRHSRSRSREVQSTSSLYRGIIISQRDKSENRFDALLDTLRSEEVEQLQKANSEDEQENQPKLRKSRSPKSRDKSEILKYEDNLYSTKLKEVVPQQVEPIQNEPDETENKKKSKKKKKNKKSNNKLTDSSQEAKATEEVFLETLSEEKQINKSDLLESNISTPESIRTPVKDRVYSDAQYWKVDASDFTELSSLSETIAIELSPEHELQLKTRPTVQSESCLTESNEKVNTPDPLNSLNSDNNTIHTNLSEEQSLESKMADLQREIEEMLLPENDNSMISDVTPKELADTNESLDEQDEITENMSPSLASPEPEDYQQIPADEGIMRETKIVFKEALPTTVTTTALETNKQNEDIFKKQEVALKIEELAELESNINLEHEKSSTKSLYSNSDSITNNKLQNNYNLKTDNFWVEKSFIDDAEKLMLASPVNKPESSLVKIDIKPEIVKVEENLINDSSFWPEKYLYHDAECHYFLQREIKTKVNNTNIHIEANDENDKDRDPGSGSGRSSDLDEKDSHGSCGSPSDSNYISMDLPGGICSWKDQTSYLSIETPTDSLLESVSEISRVGFDMSEDSLTTPTLEPVALPDPLQEPSAAVGSRTTKDELSYDIETLLEEVKLVQANLSDLPNESLEAMERGLEEGISILVKCGEAADMLEQNVIKYRQEPEVQNLMKDLVAMKSRIAKLLIQARQGLATIQVRKEAKKEIERQTQDIEEHKAKVCKLDHWLETINTELKESTQQGDVLTEDNILRYIEIYERYIREYEEYEIILKSISISVSDNSSQIREKVTLTKKTLEETKHLVINEIERLREILLQIRSAPEVIEEDISQTDRTIDSTSMPEEIVSPRDTNVIKSERQPYVEEPFMHESNITHVSTEVKEPFETKVKITTETIETQTGKSLMSDEPSVTDKSILCQPDPISTHDVSITCAPPKEIEVQTSEPSSEEKEMLENIEIKKTISDGHETIEIQSKPIIRDFMNDERSLVIGANYNDSDVDKNSTLNITHSLPQSFETIMVEPDETTTEVVVDADGTKRIIVRKVRKTLVTRQQVVHSQQQKQQLYLDEEIPRDQTFSQITVAGDTGSTSSILEGGVTQNIQYKTYTGEILSSIPSGEVTVQEFTSKPDIVIALEKGMGPEEILQIAEGEIKPHIETSSSSVTAIVQQVTKRIVKTRRRIIRKVVIIDGKEHISEEVIEEPENVEISEEQIPRISINVKDFGLDRQFTEADNNGDDDGKKPVQKDDIDEDFPKTPETTKRSESNEQDKNIQKEDTELKSVVEEFIKNEGKVDHKDLPGFILVDSKSGNAEIQTTIKKESEELDPQEYIGLKDSTIESSTTNVSSVIQRVTRKITRTKKRIIKHIKIIDGQEHVTEEVIEEPEDIEIIEEEPKLSHTLQEQNTRTKCIRIIKQVQIIDGKEHITEQVIEDSGDEYEPPLTISTDDRIHPLETKHYVVTLPPEEIYDQNKATSNNLISDICGTTEEVVPDVEKSFETLLAIQEGQNQQIQLESKSETKKTGVELTKSLIDSEISDSKRSNTMGEALKFSSEKDTIYHNPSEMTTESIIMTECLGKKKEEIHDITLDESLDKPDLDTDKSQANKKPLISEETILRSVEIGRDVQLLSESDSNKEYAKQDPNLDITNLEDNASIVSEKSIYFTGAPSDIKQSPIGISRTIVIKRIQIIDGKEHVTEEVVNEPETEEFETIAENQSFTQVLQQQGLETNRIKIIRQIRVIDGKEHITEQVFDEPGGTFIPDSTITAEIGISLTKPNSQKVSYKTPYTGDFVERSVKDTPSSLNVIDESNKFITYEKFHSDKEKTTNIDNLATEYSVTRNAPESAKDKKDEPSQDIESSFKNKEVKKHHDVEKVNYSEENITPSQNQTEKMEDFVVETAVENNDIKNASNRQMSEADDLESEKNAEGPQCITEDRVENIDLDSANRTMETVMTSYLDVREENKEKDIIEPCIHSTKEDFSEVSKVTNKDKLESQTHIEDKDSTMLEQKLEHFIDSTYICNPPVSTSPSVIQDVNTFIDAERQNFSQCLNLGGGIDFIEKLTQTGDLHAVPKKSYEKVDITMKIIKSDEQSDFKPQLVLDMSVEKFDSTSQLVKKDIAINLPVDVKITEDVKDKSNVSELISEAIHVDFLKPDKKRKRKHKHKKNSESDSVSAESPIKTPQKSLDETDSSSLSHYVELPASTPIESPKPTRSVLEQPTLSDSFIDSENVKSVDEQDYEPDGESGEPALSEKKKKLRKRKSRKSSEETLYPIETPPDEASILSSHEDKVKDIVEKTGIKSPDVSMEPEKIPHSISAQEITTTSPKEESYHTMSETSDISTVKIVEECIAKSPDSIKDEITTTITYPVSVVEEIPTQDYSIQTSPELSEPKSEPDMSCQPATVDSILQTSPTHLTDVVIQTMPKDDKEVHTQTNDNVECIEKVEALDRSVQTSRTESPEQSVLLEATTQVFASDLSLPDHKSSQTTPSIETVQVPEMVLDSKEIQTSPILKIEYDDKATEISIETIDSTIQTVLQENIDQETNTTPEEALHLSDMSIQTTSIPMTSAFTQSEEVSKDMEVPSVCLEEKSTSYDKVDITESSQQTSPRMMKNLETTKIATTTVDTMQQTSPREEQLNGDDVKKVCLEKNVTAESAQQTTPREDAEKCPEKEIDKSLITVDSIQQTSPRSYIDDSISTSNDEPYEVHLRAQISIPQATNDFLDSERQMVDFPHTILGDKHKQKKRKSKRKTESPLKSPESLSDPINAELSLSVTPTSDEFSSKDSYSIDEGIYQYPTTDLPTNKVTVVTNSRPTYSDIVQRSKSKSPSPSKTLVTPKSEKAILLNCLEKRTQTTYDPQRMSDNCMTVALIEPSVEKSYDFVVSSKLKEVKNAIENKDPNKVEKTVIVVIETISIWLEEIQYKIHAAISSGKKVPEETQRIKDLEQHVQHLKEIVYVTEVHEEIVTLIETLTRQMNAVSHLSNESVSKVRDSEDEWRKFFDEIDNLAHSVDRMKTTLEDLITLEGPSSQKLEELDKIENDNSDNSGHVKRLFKIYRSIAENNSKRECPSKLYLCDEDTRQIENAIHVERDRLLQLTSLAEEYEQTLQDFGQITDVAEALLDGKIIVSNLDHLHEEIQKHRKFFVNLSHCRAILESLEDNLDNETRAKYASLHHSLHDRATAIIDRAAGRAQQMTMAASRWSMLDQGMKEELQWLRVAEQRIPDLTNVTSMDHEQYINLYQSLSLDVSHHYAKILRLLSVTEGLQNLIVCPGLESTCSMALETLLKHQENIDVSLVRLTDFKENWFTYDHLINRIESWIQLADREMEHITPENITTTGNLRRFWELKAQHEVHNNLKTECGIQFEKAFEILPISDEMVQRQFFLKIEDKWRDLSDRIGNLHASAIQNISDRGVTSGEKLNLLEDELRELRGSLEGLKGVIKSEDELNLYIERLQVMTSRIDRIQNELGRLSLLPTAESDRLGALLTQSGILDDQIAEELERSMLLKEKIVQVQAGIGRVQKGQRRARLTLEECETAERLGSDVVERASQNCDRLLQDLGAQWKEILALRQALHTLPISLRICVSPTSIERDISALQETHAELEAACNDLCVRLRGKLQLWRRFERQLESVQGAVREADYMVELLTVQGQVDYDRLLKATERLETLSDSLSRRSGELVGELRETAAPLEASTEPSVAAKLRRQLDDAATAYEHTCANLTQLCDKYHKAVDLWSRYKEAAAAVRAFAESQEGRLHALRPDDAPATANVSTSQISSPWLR